MRKILELQLDLIKKRLEDRNITVELTDSASKFIAKEAYVPQYGARPIKRYLQRHVETLIARAIISGEITDGAHIKILEANSEIILDITAPPKVSGKKSSDEVRIQ